MTRLSVIDTGAGRDPAWLAEVYLAIVDSLQVKLIYTTPEHAVARWAALQRVLRMALQSGVAA